MSELDKDFLEYLKAYLAASEAGNAMSISGMFYYKKGRKEVINCGLCFGFAHYSRLPSCDVEQYIKTALSESGLPDVFPFNSTLRAFYTEIDSATSNKNPARLAWIREQIVKRERIKMKPFNLQEAKDGKPILTREGQPVKFVAYEPEAVFDERVIGLYLDNKTIGVWTETGTVAEHEEITDLFMAPIKQEGWAAIYNVDGPLTGKQAKAYIYPTEEVAKECEAKANAYVKMEWEE